MTKLNTLILLLFTFCLPSIAAFAQNACSQKFEVRSLKKKEGASGFDLKIESTDVYDGQLIEVVGTYQSVVQTFSGQGTEVKSFKNLKKSEYRVILEFKNETKFLCKKRVVSIDLTDTPQTW